MNKTTDSENIKISPWVGNNYSKKDLKILILGESLWYRDKNVELSQQAKEYIHAVINRDWKVKFYENIHYSFGSEYYDNNDNFLVEKFWQDVVFYEFVQYKINKNARPTKKQWEDSEPAFYEILNTFKPYIIIACGYDLFDNIPTTNGHWIKDFTCKGQTIKTYMYKINDNKTYVLRIKHPSRGFNKYFWHEVYKQFLLKYNSGQLCSIE